MDDLATTPQFRSRREARAADARKSSAPKVQSAVAVEPPQAFEPAPVAVRKLQRSEIAAIRASAAKAPRKNPFSVFAGMLLVGGMFAVAGLPAYALTDPNAGAADDTEVVVQSVVVSAAAETAILTRDGYRATTQAQLDQANSNALRAALNAEYNASGARELGDDYPWPSELRDYQGGGLSPLNYYYRECVDFVAWRLNRDAGYYAAPFKWTWKTLTPNGGNGGQWMYNWEARGWPVSKTPIVGAVAYTGGNHIAYVKAVNSDGTVFLEEYNWVPGKYSQRTIPASSVVAFLYPPS